MFSRKLMEEQEYSWRKTSAELHDSIGQNLLVINNKILQLVNNGTPEKTKTELRELSGFVSESIEEVRRISGNLYPHQLEKLGLTSSIESMLKKVSGVLGSKLQYKIEKIDGLLPKEYEIYFFRIIQEAVNNIIKHSGAKNAAVEIYTDQKYINTRIEDDGKGFDKNIFRSGLGLQNMRERASVLNGFIDVMSGPGKGTKIMVIIPYKKANHG
jgi:signal transduction histidine kinase